VTLLRFAPKWRASPNKIQQHFRHIDATCPMTGVHSMLLWRPSFLACGVLSRHVTWHRIGSDLFSVPDIRFDIEFCTSSNILIIIIRRLSIKVLRIPFSLVASYFILSFTWLNDWWWFRVCMRYSCFIVFSSWLMLDESVGLPLFVSFLGHWAWVIFYDSFFGSRTLE